MSIVEGTRLLLVGLVRDLNDNKHSLKLPRNYLLEIQEIRFPVETTV